jgi:hypothetical protein
MLKREIWRLFKILCDAGGGTLGKTGMPMYRKSLRARVDLLQKLQKKECPGLVGRGITLIT